MRPYRTVMVMILASAIAGCGGSGETVAKNTLDAMKEMTAALENGNKDQVMAVAKKLQAAKQEFISTKASKAEAQRIKEKYQPLITEENKKMLAAGIQAVTSGRLRKEDLNELGAIMRE